MTTGDGPTDAQFTDAWRVHRPYLVDLAFGMLADIGAAEDAVQEAFSRLARSDFERIEDQRGWLIVVTSRICLDQIQSARSRRERAHESSTIEFAGPAATRAAFVDPADRVTLDDEIRLALLVVLERLSPAERVVFVLHDIFQMPFDTIAESVGRPAPTCRQLARRARLKIRSERARARSRSIRPSTAWWPSDSSRRARTAISRPFSKCSTQMSPAMWTSGPTTRVPVGALPGRRRWRATFFATSPP